MDHMRRQCEYGAVICRSVRHDAELNSAEFPDSYSAPVLRTAASIVAMHHEEWAGS